MHIAIYENLPMGGAKRAAYEFGRQLAMRHTVDLYRLDITNHDAFDLSAIARNVYEYRYAPYFGLLNARLRQGHLAPRSATLFGPLRRLHGTIARDLLARRYDVVLAHTDSMTQAPYLLQFIGDLGVYYCEEVLRIGREATLQRAHRQELASSPPPVGALRLAEDAVVMRRWIATNRRSAAAAGRIIANSVYTREQVFAAYGRQATVCYPGVDAAQFTPAGGSRRHAEVLSIGSPLSRKGHDLVIRAIAAIQPVTARPRLRIIAASTSGSEALQALAGGLGVELQLETNLDETALVARYRSALATVCAARLEPFGLTVLESMACGTPVVAIREAGFRETVVDRETGLLVEPNAAALGAAIAELAGDPVLVARLGGRAREVVLDHWTWEACGRALEDRLFTRSP